MYPQTGYPLTPFCRKLTASLPFGRVYADPDEGNWKSTVVMLHCSGGLRYPSGHSLARQIEAVRTKGYLNRCTPELQSSRVRH
jgi:hypothetical protein